MYPCLCARPCRAAIDITNACPVASIGHMLYKISSVVDPAATTRTYAENQFVWFNPDNALSVDTAVTSVLVPREGKLWYYLAAHAYANDMFFARGDATYYTTVQYNYQDTMPDGCRYVTAPDPTYRAVVRAC